MIVLTKAASMNLDLMSGDWELMHFHGRHNLERQMERVPLMRGKMTVESVRGASSHQHNPFAIIVRLRYHRSQDHVMEQHWFTVETSRSKQKKTRWDRPD